MLTLLTAALLAVSGPVAIAAPAGGRPGQPTALRVENLVEPIGIDAAKPLLSWLPARDQAAYEIRATLDSPSRDLWDSGRVRSAGTSNVAYGGPALHARDHVRWQVRTWDTAGRVSPWSAQSSWEMGLLSAADWSARWIENPSYPQGTIEFLDEVNWGGAIIRIPWQLYLTYGDTRTMTTYYDNMVAWLDYEAANKAANNGDIPGLGDWSATDNTTPMQLPITAGYYTAASTMADIAKVLGKADDHAKYTALATQLAAEFTTRFRHVDATGVFYGSDSEASNAMALDAGLVAPADRGAVLDRLVASVRKAGNHVTTGSVALGPLFRALQAGNRDDVLYDMVVNPTSPGYGYLIAGGHTTLSESLDGSGSQNHHFLGEVDAWFVRGVAGIQQTPGSVGYRTLTIAPGVVGDLTHASASYRTPLGTVSSSWTKSGHEFRLRVTVPPGATATVRLPGSAAARTVGSGEHTFTTSI
ncbi:alpha-L-rhamnosidase C-terminal domain-containing protein [Amycolatopsis sp. cmx-4-68]|uniref:alpha-L-rhamnosidase-related protein n=1 Tax=Amycolatopsis sp. cmx-4-68 TaxID=2790938 RepID=UPI00397D5B8A